MEAADTISTNRPGAQKETLEGFIKRMEKLESIAASFSGVQNAYAIQAGRELRVIVDSDLLTDAETDRLVSEISDRVEKEMDFPGQIKISVIREMRAVDYAMAGAQTQVAASDPLKRPPKSRKTPLEDPFCRRSLWEAGPPGGCRPDPPVDRRS